MTTFVETLALLAILNGDDAEAEQLVNDMSPAERQALAKAADNLSAMCTQRCAVCDERIRHRDPRGVVHTRPFGDGGVLHHATCPLPEQR